MKLLIDISEKDYRNFVLQNDSGILDEKTPSHRAKIAIANGIEASQEHKVGKWLGKWLVRERGDTDLYQCSICGEPQCCASNYCSACGAKMKGAEE